MAPKSTPEHRRLHIEAWRSSGLSQAAYCRQNGINLTTFTNWLSHDKKQPQLQTNLVPVRIESAQPSSSNPLIFRSGRGYILELPASQPAQWVAELIRCLG
jgi:hypothetical protein